MNSNGFQVRGSSAVSPRGRDITSSYLTLEKLPILPQAVAEVSTNGKLVPEWNPSPIKKADTSRLDRISDTSVCFACTERRALDKNLETSLQLSYMER